MRESDADPIATDNTKAVTTEIVTALLYREADETIIVGEGLDPPGEAFQFNAIQMRSR